MGLFFFFFCVIVTTWTQHIQVSLLVLLLCFGVLIVIRLGQKKSVGFVVLQCLLAVVGVVAGMTRQEMSYQNQEQYLDATIVMTGEVVSRIDKDTYDVLIGGVMYRYQSDSIYAPGVELWITGNYKPGWQHSVWLESFDDRLSSVAIKDILKSSAQKARDWEFDYLTWMKMKGYHGVIYEQNAVVVDVVGGSRRDVVKHWLVKRLIDVRGESRTTALVLGMLIGDRSLLKSGEYESFIASGLVHIIAVSGGNIVMLVVFFSAMLFFVPFFVRVVILFCIILLFSLLVGPDSSVIRATLMGCLALIALMSGRRLVSTRALALVAVMMLLYSPYYLLYDVGFVFSFSAVLGLAKSGRYVRRDDCNKMLYPLKMVRNNYLLPSIGASVGVLPFLLFFVGSFNLWSIIANVIVLPIVPLVMVGGVLVGLLGDGVQFLVGGLSFLVDYVFLVSDVVVSHGWYVILNGKWFMLGILPWWIRWLLIRVKK